MISASTRAPHPRRETYLECPEVHVAGVCVRGAGPDRHVLLCRRSADRALFPGLWEGCGGQLRRGETFAQGVERHYQNELGITVTALAGVCCIYQIDEPVIPGVRLLCLYQGGEPTSLNHSEIRWTRLSEVLAMPWEAFVPGLQNQIGALTRQEAALSPQA